MSDKELTLLPVSSILWDSSFCIETDVVSCLLGLGKDCIRKIDMSRTGGCYWRRGFTGVRNQNPGEMKKGLDAVEEQEVAWKSRCRRVDAETHCLLGRRV